MSHKFGNSGVAIAFQFHSTLCYIANIVRAELQAAVYAEEGWLGYQLRVGEELGFTHGRYFHDGFGYLECQAKKSQKHFAGKDYNLHMLDLCKKKYSK